MDADMMLRRAERARLARLQAASDDADEQLHAGHRAACMAHFYGCALNALSNALSMILRLGSQEALYLKLTPQSVPKRILQSRSALVGRSCHGPLWWRSPHRTGIRDTRQRQDSQQEDQRSDGRGNGRCVVSQASDRRRVEQSNGGHGIRCGSYVAPDQGSDGRGNGRCAMSQAVRLIIYIIDADAALDSCVSCCTVYHGPMSYSFSQVRMSLVCTSKFLVKHVMYTSRERSTRLYKQQRARARQNQTLQVGSQTHLGTPEGFNISESLLMGRSADYIYYMCPVPACAVLAERLSVRISGLPRRWLVGRSMCTNQF